MRFIYLDEAGISNPANEPYLVVAGVIIDADHQWMAVEPHLHVLAETCAPQPRRPNFVFHAVSSGEHRQRALCTLECEPSVICLVARVRLHPACRWRPAVLGRLANR